MDIVALLAGSIPEALCYAAGREIDYLIHYNKIIKTLEKQAKKLAGKRDRVQAKTEAAGRTQEISDSNVENWIAEVDKITAEAETFLVEVKTNRSCCWRMNPKQRYRYGKEAKEKTLVISKLLEDQKGSLRPRDDQTEETKSNDQKSSQTEAKETI